MVFWRSCSGHFLRDIIPTMFDKDDFSHDLHYLLTNIFDFVILEKHPLVREMVVADPGMSRAETFRKIVRECIESLQPEESSSPFNSIEWRYYLILKGRYVDYLSMSDLQGQLALGERQLRRLNARALEVLTNLLIKRLNPKEVENETFWPDQENLDYPLSLELLNLNHIVVGVSNLCQARAATHNSEIKVSLSQNLPLIRTDRVLLRQVILGILSYALENLTDDPILLSTRLKEGKIIYEVEVTCSADATRDFVHKLKNKLNLYWLERIGADIEIREEPQKDKTVFTVQLNLTDIRCPIILIVDDHEAAFRMIQRYLAKTSIQVQGTNDPSEIIKIASSQQPKGILLDVMMPGMDGWEVLQALKSDPETRKIPVIICSVWNEPEMAFSLGADGYLKKPFNQADLLNVLRQVGVVNKQDVGFLAEPEG